MVYDEVLAGRVRACLREDAGAAATGTCGASYVRLDSWRTCGQLAAGRGLDPGAVAARLAGIAVRAVCAGTGAIS
jgi:hypothetical protein